MLTRLGRPAWLRRTIVVSAIGAALAAVLTLALILGVLLTLVLFSWVSI